MRQLHSKILILAASLGLVLAFQNCGKTQKTGKTDSSDFAGQKAISAVHYQIQDPWTAAPGQRVEVQFNSIDGSASVLISEFIERTQAWIEKCAFVQSDPLAASELIQAAQQITRADSSSLEAVCIPEMPNVQIDLIYKDGTLSSGTPLCARAFTPSSIPVANVDALLQVFGQYFSCPVQ